MQNSINRLLILVSLEHVRFFVDDMNIVNLLLISFKGKRYIELFLRPPSSSHTSEDFNLMSDREPKAIFHFSYMISNYLTRKCSISAYHSARMFSDFGAFNNKASSKV